MSFQSKASVFCFYCGKSLRRDKLLAHTKSKHPNSKVKEKLGQGAQDIKMLIWQKAPSESTSSADQQIDILDDVGSSAM